MTKPQISRAPPRPDICSAETYVRAAREFFRVRRVPTPTGGGQSETEMEGLILRSIGSLNEYREAWKLSREVESLMGARVQGLAAYCEELLESAAEIQELLQYEWVKENGIANPVLCPRRVVVRRWTGVRVVEEEGLALPGGDCVLLGMFRFLSDRRRADVDGEIFSTLVLRWEDILQEKTLTDDDDDLLRRSDKAAAQREARRKAAIPSNLETTS